MTLPEILDNKDCSVLDGLKRMLVGAREMRVATGYFEVGSLLDLDGLWQPLEAFRVLMGDETTRRTRQELVNAARALSDGSIEAAKEKDDTLRGLAAIREALRTGVLETRVYTRAKFHAKTYLIDTPSPVNYGVVGSSNFTHPGLTQNIELNLFTTQPSQLKALREWFDARWAEGVNIQEDLLGVIDRHLREYTPFEVYVKTLHDFFLGRQVSETMWEQNESCIYKMLSQYQKDGYHQARRIADDWGGALICDGVGLGKTFIGLMLLEYYAAHQRKNVLLIVPKSARESVWESNLHSHLRHLVRSQVYARVIVRSHTDFGRQSEKNDELVEELRHWADVVIVDEAHQFRNTGPQRSEYLRRMTEGKRTFLMTATPINNSLLDLYHLIGYFARTNKHFDRIGIHNLLTHFKSAEKRLAAMVAGGGAEPVAPDIQAVAQADDLLRSDALLKALVIQRSRAYVRASEKLADSSPVFPDRQKPVVIRYSLKDVYGALYDDFTAAFGGRANGKGKPKGPGLKLAIYKREAYNRQKAPNETLNVEEQVVGLIRTNLLKRLESSYKAFEGSLTDLLWKMGRFRQVNDDPTWQAWVDAHSDTWNRVEAVKAGEDTTGEDDEDIGDEETLKYGIDPKQYRLGPMMAAVIQDMDLLAAMSDKLAANLTPETDTKLQHLKDLIGKIQAEPSLASRKVVIFTQFKDTARYLARELERAGYTDIEQLDSSHGDSKESVIKRFAPHYNHRPGSSALRDALAEPINILVSTDVLSEGLNLQDATRLVNYDIHWNPVRLMQRIGRVDRRLNLSLPLYGEGWPKNPDGRPDLRVWTYNFLPPEELDDLLGLLRRVSGKVLRINKTLGLEAAILGPDDEVEAMRQFNAGYEGEVSAIERMELAWQSLQKDHADVVATLGAMPYRLFSGRKGKVRGLFCAYRFPATASDVNGDHEEPVGEIGWYFRDANGTIWESFEECFSAIQCPPDEPRTVEATPEDRKAWREDIEARKVRPKERTLQVGAGQKTRLLCWMEIS